jgi:CheY-like chemotaxis protein
VVEIEDSGPGLDDSELSRLFQPFFQARAGIEARGGTGLGLALSLELARAFGGSIAVESRLKRGSCFRLDVPCREGSAPKGAPPGDSGRPLGLVDPAASPKILVADDDPGQTWVVELLTAVGFQVRHVLNGAEAVDAFDAWAPDMILMDMNMPVLDGYAATRRIRERQASRPVVIVIVTASGFEENRAEAYGAGADGWLRKPLRDDALLGDIGARLGVQYRHGGPPRGERPSTLPPRDLSVLAAALPIELVATLRAAIQAADFEEAQRVIDRIPREHGAAAEALREQLDRFGYDALLRALAETGSSAPTS